MRDGGVSRRIIINRKALAAVTSRRLLSAATCALSVVCIFFHAHEALAQAAQSQGATQATRQFNIPAQPLTNALAQFGRQSGLQVSFPSEASRGLKSNAVNGNLTPSQALARLLQGTGVSYRITPQGTAIVGGSANADGGVAPDGSLLLNPIDVTARGGAADTPYETPGSSAHISREQLDRIPPTSPGDVFISTPGVISAGNRVGTSINPNIRGLQGMSRVVTSVDGARQTTSSYRGYLGNRDETYIDPDLIGGIDISKGPSDGTGIGAVGGTVNFRTISPDDIIPEGKSWGVRLKGSVGNNSVGPRALPGSAGAGVVPPSATNTSMAERPAFFGGDTWSGSAAFGVKQENYEITAAYAKRNQGNYFAGTKVPEGVIFAPAPNRNSLINPGQEVWNTSQDTESVLLKGKVKWGDGQSLELGFNHYESHYGLANELNLSFQLVSGILPYGQFPLSHTDVSTYTAKYEYNPAGNDLVNLRANLWSSDVHTQEAGDELVNYGIRTIGGDVSNKSRFDTVFGALTWDNGVEIVREHADAVQFPSTITYSQGWETLGPSGERLLTGVHSKASLEVTRWLTLTGGARYDHYDSVGEGYLTKFPERSGERISPNAAIILSPVQGVQFFAKYTEGYRPPTLRETHWHYQGLLWNNPYLKGEVAKNQEFGMNILRDNAIRNGDRLRFKVAYFDNHTNDYIVRLRPATIDGVRLPGDNPTRYHWFNIDDAHYRGFEISGSYDAGKFFVEGAFNKYIAVEYCNRGVCAAPQSNPASGAALDGDYSANYIPPDYAGSVTAGLRFFDQKLTLGGRMIFSSARVGGIWPPATTGAGVALTWPQYTVYDLFASYKFTKDTVLNFSIENLTDEYYFGALSSTAIPSPGRTGRMSLSFTF